MSNPYFTTIMDFFNWLFEKGPQVMALSAIVYWVYLQVVKPVAGVGRKVSQLVIDTDHLKTDFKKIRSDTDEIKAELQSNGGGSLKDAVKRVEDKTDEQTKKLVALEQGHTEIKAFQTAQAAFMTPRVSATKKK